MSKISQTTVMKTTNNLSLDKIGKELPFSVPENYFEQFAKQIDTQIGLSPKSVHKIIRPWMLAAAVFVGLAILTPVFYTSSNQQITAQSTENYESYVLSQVDETALLDCYVDDSSIKK